jgi:hypothetical protein
MRTYMQVKHAYATDIYTHVHSCVTDLYTHAVSLSYIYIYIYIYIFIHTHTYATDMHTRILTYMHANIHV